MASIPGPGVAVAPRGSGRKPPAPPGRKVTTLPKTGLEEKRAPASERRHKWGIFILGPKRAVRGRKRTYDCRGMPRFLTDPSRARIVACAYHSLNVATPGRRYRDAARVYRGVPLMYHAAQHIAAQKRNASRKKPPVGISLFRRMYPPPTLLPAKKTRIRDHRKT